MFLALLFWWKLLIVFSFFVQNILIKKYIYNKLSRVIGTVLFFFYERYFKHKKHLSNIYSGNIIYTSRYLLKHLKNQMLLFIFFRFIILMKVTHCILFLSIYLSKKLFIASCVNHIFLSVYLSKTFIALHLNKSCLCALLCFLSVLRYLNKACVFFFRAKYLDKKNNKLSW